jgi:hypothetical protein
MIVAISKKGSKGKRPALTRKRTRRKSLEYPRSLQSNHTSMVRLPTYLGGNTGGYYSCQGLNSLPKLAYKKSDGGLKLRTTCSERIRAKGVYPPPPPYALYRGISLKIFVKTLGEINDHRRNH